ncbi:hypothetical protein GQ53DRAFT_331618 [Thozetella sp. PMI_491]|nr:hypothetical protein GQ53DRAFT_331618 [Thozetella sp. PMI_491]
MKFIQTLVVGTLLAGPLYAHVLEAADDALQAIRALDEPEKCLALHQTCRKNSQCCSKKCEGHKCKSCRAEKAVCFSHGDCCSGSCEGGIIAKMCV